ncbi:MAG: biotin-dependent carboxyltransferase family protein [Gemmataceae bacterium]
MSLLVLDPGLSSRLVDFGRPNSRGLGVPVGGAGDRAGLILGNGLVGNPPDALALEIALRGPTLRADAEVGCVLFGAPFDMSTARQKPRSGRTFTLAAGEELHITGTPTGMRAYFCVRGGFEAPLILGGHSGLDDVRRGDRLRCAASRIATRFLAERPDLSSDGPVRCVPGLQADWFNVAEFYGQTFTVSPALNRMGVRLQGQPLTLPERELVSEPVCPGAVQVTSDGQCIVLGVDGQTIGGYPKIAHVIQADLDRLGQLRPGAPVRFIPVPHDEARRLFLQREDALQAWWRRLTISLE